jgi:hypothetical protein
MAPAPANWHNAAMSHSITTPDPAAELKRLQAELTLATKRAAEAARTYGRPLDARAQQRVTAEEAKVAKIKSKIEALEAK